MLAVLLRLEDWILSYDTTIVFHFDIQTIVRQDSITQLQDLGKTFGSEPMFDVVADVSLQQNRFCFGSHTAAIDKVLHDMTDFGHMRVRRNMIAIRQNKPRESFLVRSKNRFEIIQFHSQAIYPYRNIVN